jgi:SAM-dependent methyltransferase
MVTPTFAHDIVNAEHQILGVRFALVSRFGPESVEKMVDWILDHYSISTDSTESPSILEIGCGNGVLLFAAHEAGYDPEKMHGIDYSENAISLAKSVASKKETGDAALIKFTKHDFLTEDIPRDDTTSGGWDLILDKGTFDAISLGKKDESGHAPHQLYPQRLSALMKPGGRFLITCKTGFCLHSLSRKLMTLQLVILRRMS